MTARELRRAAKCDLSYNATIDGKVLAEHILSTVRDDDDEPVTLKKLQLLGGMTFTTREWCVSWQGVEFAFEDDGTLVEIDLVIEGYSKQQHIAGRFLPRNMLEARQLLERCGAIKETA